MKRQLAMCGVAAVVTLAAVAPADIMTWTWQVDRNDQPVDASRPVAVESGDRLVLTLWAGFDPYRFGFASAGFAIETTDALFTLGQVNIAEPDGFGRSDVFQQYPDSPGTPTDSDDNGTPNRIDAIGVYQLPRFFNAWSDWRNPLPIYSIGWDVTQEVDQPFAIRWAAMDGSTAGSRVYTDEFGTVMEYQNAIERLYIVPAPSSMALLFACGMMRRRDRSEAPS